MIPRYVTYVCLKCRYKTTKEEGCLDFPIEACPICHSSLEIKKTPFSPPRRSAFEKILRFFQRYIRE